MAKKQLGTPEFVALVSLTTSLTAVSIDAILPGLRDIGEAFQVTNSNNTQLIVSLFIFGMVFGELIFGPVSDAIGRKAAIMYGLVIFVAGTVLAMTAVSFEVLLVGRIVQGIGVSGAKIASRALIRDLYEGDEMARIMSFVFVVFIIVPMLAPTLGQGVLIIGGWRAVFVLYFGLAAVVAIWMGVRQAETLAPARRIRLSLRTVLRNGSLIVRHPRVMAYTFAAGFIFGAQLLYLATAQAIFADLFDAGRRFPLYFAILALGIGLASFLNSQMVMRYGMHRLSVGALWGLIMASGLLLVVALGQGGVPSFAVFMVLCFLIFFCIGILFGNLNAMAMQSLGNVAGIGASIIASISSALAVVLSIGIGRFYNMTVLPLAGSYILAGVAGLLLVVAAKRCPEKAI